MKKLTSIFIFLVAVAFVFTQLYAGGGNAEKFENMKKLAGQWEGRTAKTCGLPMKWSQAVPRFWKD